MREVHFGDEAVAVQGSPWAAFVYQREFDADWNMDYVAAFEGFGETRWTYDIPFLLRTCWAMARNHDDAFPPFEEWARSLDCSCSARAPWVKEVLEAVKAEMFRIGEEGGAQGEPVAGD